MDFKTSSAESENTQHSNYDHHKVVQENVAKFYATITNVSRSMRKDDWTYLQRHPEIRAIIRAVITEAVRVKPPNIILFAAEMFSSNNEQKLIELINQQLKWVNEQLRGGVWTPADGFFTFPESSSDSGDNQCPPENKTHANLESEPDLACPENFKPSCK
ncbi:hypothetical protein KR018_001923 [Drosophila ironensis]|nr:hypothetical protein KR018_001923 [Drosophila ironensis]